MVALGEIKRLGLTKILNIYIMAVCYTPSSKVTYLARTRIKEVHRGVTVQVGFFLFHPEISRLSTPDLLLRHQLGSGKYFYVFSNGGDERGGLK